MKLHIFAALEIKGLYFDNHIAINKDIPTDTEKGMYFSGRARSLPNCYQ